MYIHIYQLYTHMCIIISLKCVQNKHIFVVDLFKSQMGDPHWLEDDARELKLVNWNGTGVLGNPAWHFGPLHSFYFMRSLAVPFGISHWHACLMRVICFRDQCRDKLTGTNVQVETGKGCPAQSSGRERASDVTCRWLGPVKERNTHENGYFNEKISPW